MLISSLALSGCGARTSPSSVVAAADPSSLGSREMSIVNEFNRLIPERPVTDIRFFSGNCESSTYDDKAHAISISLSGAHSLESTVHEMGHAVYQVRLTSGEDAKRWERIHRLSLYYDNFEMVRDRRYLLPERDSDRCGNAYRAGHPGDNASELFASSIAAFRVRPDLLAANISDPGKINAHQYIDAPEPFKAAVVRSNHGFGLMVYIFLRDRFFSGQTFLPTDPFRAEKFSEEYLRAYEFGFYPEALCASGGMDSDFEVRQILEFPNKDTRLLAALERMLTCDNLLIGQVLLRVIGELGTTEDWAIRTVEKGLSNSYAPIREQAAQTLQKLK